VFVEVRFNLLLVGKVGQYFNTARVVAGTSGQQPALRVALGTIWVATFRGQMRRGLSTIPEDWAITADFLASAVIEINRLLKWARQRYG
jgi:hypothetical protein